MTKASAVENVAGHCLDCGGAVYHRGNKPGEFDHNCASAAQKVKSTCKCSLRTRLVGDGCEICNPEKAREYEADAVEKRRIICPTCGAEVKP